MNLAEALDGLYADLGLGAMTGLDGNTVEQPQGLPVRRQDAPLDPTDFSEQLKRLRSALGEAAGVKPGAVEESLPGNRESSLVPVQIP